MPLSYWFEIIFLVYLLIASFLAFILIKKKKARWLAILLLLSVAAIIYSGYLEPYWLKMRYQTVEIGKINTPIKIAFLSDLHFRPFKGAGWVKRTAEKIRQEKPDLILIAGDLLFHDDIDFFRQDVASLKTFSAVAPTYVVLGNHDFGLGNRARTILFPDQHEALKEILESGGVNVLIDEKKLVKIKDEEIWLVGFRELWDLGANPSALLNDLPDDGRLKIGVSHHPDSAFLPQAEKLDLLLSGHTHGGQIRLPWFGSLADAETDLPRADYGRYLPDHQPKILNTVGIGEAGLHLRFWNRPEVVVMEIR